MHRDAMMFIEYHLLFCFMLDVIIVDIWFWICLDPRGPSTKIIYFNPSMHK